MSEHPDIVVTAFTRRYLAAFDRVLGIEGGYVNDPVDRGGATKYGVSLRFLVAEGRSDQDGDGFADFDLDMDGDIDVADIKALTPQDAKYLFRRCFWDRLDCERFPAPIGEALFDQGVNGGNAAARRLLQRALNAILRRWSNASDRPVLLVEDGVVGAVTWAAFTWVLKWPAAGMPALIAAYRVAAADRYRAIVAANPLQARFLKGWLHRASDLGRP